MNDAPGPRLSADALVEQLRSAQFTLVRARDAYAPVQVDDFLDGLVVAVRQGNPVEPLIDLVRFGRPHVGKGYAAVEVDQFLALVGDRASGRPVAGDDHDDADTEQQPLPASYTAAPGVVAEQRGLLRRLLRR